MSDTATKPADPPRESEEWFLEQLDQPELPVADILRVLDRLAARGGRAQADARGRMLQEMLQENGDTARAMEVLERRARWRPSDPAEREQVRDEALALVGGDRRKKERVPHAGFDADLPPAEAVRRLQVLLALDEGTLCYDKTWGFGVVRRVDDFQKRVEIDFESKRGHFMTFAYAGETLQVLEPEHLLARLHDDPEGTRALVTEAPGEIVRVALRSFGPLPVALLQEQLVPRVVAAEDWKRFWEGARRELRADPLVDIPSRRTDPLVLRTHEEDFGAAWFKRLAADRDMASIVDRVEALVEAGRAAELDEASRAAVGERLAFVVRGAERRHPALVARAAMAAQACSAPASELDVGALVAAFLKPARLRTVLHALPARRVRPFLDFLVSLAGPEVLDRVLGVMDTLEIGVLSDAIDVLVAQGREEEAVARVREMASEPAGHIPSLLWVYRHPARIGEWRLPHGFELAKATFNAVEQDVAGDRLKGQNQLRERFARSEWLQEVVNALDEGQRRQFMLRLRDTHGWPVLERQGILGRVVKLYPELEPLLQTGPAHTGGSRRAVRRTSWRSYRERQQQLEKIVGEEIPRNSREIGVARSYGDLRENFEYKAAKEMQTILMRRQAELEQQLHEVEATEFEDAPLDRAGPGTGVRLAFGDGHTETYYILGVWDRDEERYIVSSETRLAQALDGHRAGDEVVVPRETGEAPARVAAVLPLSDDVRAWMRGEAAAAGDAAEAPAAGGE